jgi:hypothetical protein
MDVMIRRTLTLATAFLLALAPAAAATAAPAQAPGCEIESASLSWGFKESFRAYIDGSIANGEWTVGEGATYATPEFGFLATDGRIDPRAPLGSISFAGSVHFTGHGGILDTTVANPVLVLRADDTAVLLLDVSGPTMEGDQVAVTGAVFVDVDLAGQDFTSNDGIITIVDAPTTLTEEGAEAFPNYEAGETFDPISARIDVGDCDLTGLPIGTDSTEEDVIGDATPFLIVGAVVLAALVAVVAIVVARRRR